jgi:fucose permease
MERNYSFRKVFVAACMGMLLFGVVLISLGSLMPTIVDKYLLDTMQAGSLATILPAGILLGSLFFGPIVDRYSYRNLMVISTLIIIVGLESIAIASNIFMLQIAFFLIGLGGGALNGGTNALVADISDSNPTKRSANLSLLGVFFGIGALGVPSLLAILSSVYSFEIILQYTGIVILFPLVYFMVISYPIPKQLQAIPLRKCFALIKDKHLVLLAFFLFFQSALEGIINNWTTTFLQNGNQFDSREALMLLSLFVLSLTLTRLLLAAVLSRISPYVTLMISIVILLSGALLLLLPISSMVGIVGLVLLGIGTAAGFPVILGYVSELYTELRGTAFSFVIFIGLIGNILVNYLMGLIANRYSIEIYPWILLICIGSLLWITIFRLKRMLNKLN